MTWTFGRKLALGFAVAVLTVVMIGISGYRATAELIENTRWVTHTHEVQREIAQASSAVKDAETGQRGFLLTGEGRFLEPYSRAHADATRALSRLRLLTADNPEQQRRLAQLSQFINERFERLRARIDKRRAQGLEAVANPAELDEGRRQMDQIQQEVSEMVQAESVLLIQRHEASERSATGAQRTILWGSVLGALLVISAGTFISRSLSAQIGVAVRHVQTSAAELQAAANQQATGAKELTTGMNEITATITQLRSMSRQIAESAQRIAQIADQTANQARTGEATVSQGSEAVSTIKRQVDTIVNHMLELNKKAQQIGAVLEMVSELAEQTNVLAINAAVEAASAGESGRRFAVVADEIRKLADRIGGSTKEIRGLIDDVRAAVNTSVMTTEAGSKAAEAGAAQFVHVAASFGEISAQVMTATSAAQEIELSTRQQATAVDQVKVAITNVAQASKENAVSTDQTLHTASELAALSRDLLRLVEAQRHAKTQHIDSRDTQTSRN